METLQMLLEGFQVAFTPANIGAALLGAILGIIVGAMPGIGSLVGVALLLPLTFKFNPTTAIIMLGAIYYSNMFGGAFSAILLNIPGDAPAIMTTMDGYPLAKKGKAGKALLTANVSSFAGGLIGMVILVALGPALAKVGLKFGPAEMTTLMLLAMSSISWIVGENIIKGLVSTCLGILLATVGIDIVSGVTRYNFGSMYLLGGINFIPLVVGFIGMSQVFDLVVSRKDGQAQLVHEGKLTIRDSLLTRHELKRISLPIAKSGLMGAVIGFIPGAGATMASFLGYAIQKKSGKNEEELGTGAVEGIAAAEAANNAAAAGAFGPLLSLGIPGSGTAAVLLGGLMMWGLTPGPMLFQTNPDFAWGLIASLFLANLISLVIALGIIPWIMRIITIPTGIMIPSIMIICFVGAFATSNSMFGVIVMLAGGLLGYIFKKNDYPTAPLLLAFILSSTLQKELRRSFIISGGSLKIFVEKPISLFFLVAFVLLMLSPVIKKIVKKIIAKKKLEA